MAFRSFTATTRIYKYRLSVDRNMTSILDFATRLDALTSFKPLLVR